MVSGGGKGRDMARLVTDGYHINKIKQPPPGGDHFESG